MNFSKFQNFKPRGKQRGFLQFLPLLAGGLNLLSSRRQPNQVTQTQGGYSTSTSQNQLPQQITNPAYGALQQAGRNLQQNSGVAPVPGIINQAVNQLGMPQQNQFATGQFSNPFSSGQNQNNAPTASMFASGGQINPYLDKMFNQASLQTRNQLGTEFANAGRFGSGSHISARAQDLSGLAANIYGQGYESERQRQYGAAESGVNRGLAQQEANLGRQFAGAESDLTRRYGATEGNLGRGQSAIGQMLGAGQYLQQDAQNRINQPNTILNQYIAQLSGLAPFFPGTQTQSTNQSGNVTQPTFKDPASSFLGGAMLGQYLQPGLAGLGSIFGGGGGQAPNPNVWMGDYDQSWG